MKKKPLFIVTLFAMSLLFSNCKKESTPPPPPPPTTSLSITVMDDLGNKSTGANVFLYSTETDWLNQTNSIGESKTTDALGMAKFDGLSAIKYYWLVKKDCKNNVFGSATTSSAIVGNLNNNVTTVLGSTGAMKFTSNSTNPYKIYVDGTYLVDVNGGATYTLPYFKTGSHSIRVLQISGYLVTPTDKTYTGTLSCGGTLTTTFPN